jgi:hypothetical protein
MRSSFPPVSHLDLRHRLDRPASVPPIPAPMPPLTGSRQAWKGTHDFFARQPSAAVLLWTRRQLHRRLAGPTARPGRPPPAIPAAHRRLHPPPRRRIAPLGPQRVAHRHSPQAGLPGRPHAGGPRPVCRLRHFVALARMVRPRPPRTASTGPPSIGGRGGPGHGRSETGPGGNFDDQRRRRPPGQLPLPRGLRRPSGLPGSRARPELPSVARRAADRPIDRGVAGHRHPQAL